MPTLRGTEPATMSGGMSPGDALALRAANSDGPTSRARCRVWQSSTNSTRVAVESWKRSKSAPLPPFPPPPPPPPGPDSPSLPLPPPAPRLHVCALMLIIWPPELELTRQAAGRQGARRRTHPRARLSTLPPSASGSRGGLNETRAARSSNRVSARRAALAGSLGGYTYARCHGLLCICDCACL